MNTKTENLVLKAWCKETTKTAVFCHTWVLNMPQEKKILSMVIFFAPPLPPPPPLLAPSGALIAIPTYY